MKFTTTLVMTSTLALIGVSTVSSLPLELVYRAHQREARNAAPSPYAEAYTAPEVPQVYPVLNENTSEDTVTNDDIYQFSPPPPPPPSAAATAITRRSQRRVRARATAAAVAQLIEEELEERRNRERDLWYDEEAEETEDPEEEEDFDLVEREAADEIVAAYEGGRIAARLRREAERQERRDEYIRSFRFHRRAADLEDYSY